MTDPVPVPDDARLVVRALSQRKATRFAYAPDPAARAAMAADLGLLGLPALRFSGVVTPQGKGDMRLEGRLEAVAMQACVVTLAPVRAQIGEAVERTYLKDWQEPAGDEVEVPEDDSAEPMPEVIDLAAVAAEALALALPPYPRAPGAELGSAAFAPLGAAPIDLAAEKPFAGLAALRDKLEKGGQGTE